MTPDEKIQLLRNALEPFAAKHLNLDDGACHKGICSAEQCGNCGRILRARRALAATEPTPPTPCQVCGSTAHSSVGHMMEWPATPPTGEAPEDCVYCDICSVCPDHDASARKHDDACNWSMGDRCSCGARPKPTRIEVTTEEFERIVELVNNPPPPTQALRDLMRGPKPTSLNVEIQPDGTVTFDRKKLLSMTLEDCIKELQARTKPTEVSLSPPSTAKPSTNSGTNSEPTDAAKCECEHMWDDNAQDYVCIYCDGRYGAGRTDTKEDANK